MRGMLIIGLLLLTCGLFQGAQAQTAGPDEENAPALSALGLQRGMMPEGGPYGYGRSAGEAPGAWSGDVAAFAERTGPG